MMTKKLPLPTSGLLHTAMVSGPTLRFSMIGYGGPMCARANVDVHSKRIVTARQRRSDVGFDLAPSLVIKSGINLASRIDLRIRFRSPSHHGCAHIHRLSHEPDGAEKQHEADSGPGSEC